MTQDEVSAFYSNVSNNVKVQRKLANLTQMELALDIGIKSVAFYSNAENNKYNKHFNLEHLFKIAHRLEIDICLLITTNRVDEG